MINNETKNKIMEYNTLVKYYTRQDITDKKDIITRLKALEKIIDQQIGDSTP